MWINVFKYYYDMYVQSKKRPLGGIEIHLIVFYFTPSA